MTEKKQNANKSETKSKKANRSNYFTSIIYQESIKENYKEILKDNHISFMISPLHDKDMSANGDPKKPHYHLVLMFDSLKSFEQAQEIFNSIGSVGCEIVKSLRSMARYLCHLDDYDKSQYNKSDVYCYGGIDYEKLIACDSDKWQEMMQIEDLIETLEIENYYLLCGYLRKNNSELYKTLVTHTVHFKALLQSKEYLRKTYLEKSYIHAKNGLKQAENIETGEISTLPDIPENELPF